MTATPATVQVRLAHLEDAAQLADLMRSNREFLAPWEPLRDDDFFTEAGQQTLLRKALTRYEQELVLPCAIVVEGRIVGRIDVNDIVRGAFQSAHLGYWVAETHTGRGIATSAVKATVRWAFDLLGLHRLQADTLVDNPASQKVLARNGFTQIGTAPRYLQIAGRWQDCRLYQLLNEPVDEVAPPFSHSPDVDMGSPYDHRHGG